MSLFIDYRFSDKLLSNGKSSVIRYGKKEYPLGPDSVILGDRRVLVDITHVTHTSYYCVTEEDALCCGFDSKALMTLDLKEYYPDLDEDSEVTIIRFEVL